MRKWISEGRTGGGREYPTYPSFRNWYMERNGIGADQIRSLQTGRQAVDSERHRPT